MQTVGTWGPEPPPRPPFPKAKSPRKCLLLRMQRSEVPSPHPYGPLAQPPTSRSLSKFPPRGKECHEYARRAPPGARNPGARVAKQPSVQPGNAPASALPTPNSQMPFWVPWVLLRGSRRGGTKLDPGSTETPNETPRTERLRNETFKLLFGAGAEQLQVRNAGQFTFRSGGGASRASWTMRTPSPRCPKPAA